MSPQHLRFRRRPGSEPADEPAASTVSSAGRAPCVRLHAKLQTRLLVAGLLAGLASAFPAAAHDSPEHVIEWLTARIKAQPHRADLFWQRAVEYRALGELAPAARDLRNALQQDPGFLPALVDLSRVQLAQGKKRQAGSTIERALARATDETGRAPLRMVRAEIRSQNGDWRGALADCDEALRSAPAGELDWYLTRSQVQCRLGLFRAAVQGLEEGFARTGCAVLEVESIDAMLEGGFFAEAAQKLQPLLAEARWQSAWLIRRARTRLGLGELASGQEDLLAAIRELNERVRGTHPDSSLLADRGLAYALLGEETLAKADLEAARKLGADPIALRRVESALAKARE